MPTYGMSSQNCKYKMNEVDEFTNDRILETKADVFTISGMGLGFSCGYSLKKINDQRYLKLNVMSPSIVSLREGDEIMFKTDKEETINMTFPTTVIAEGIYNSALKSTHWNASILIPIPDNVNERFLNETLIKLRVYTTDGYVDDDIKAKRAKKFVEYLKCIQ